MVQQRKGGLLESAHRAGPETDTAVVVHIYHRDVWADISETLFRLDADYDLHVTINPDLLDELQTDISSRFPNATIHPIQNSGMDIVPFLKIIPELAESYKQVLKIHTKKGKSGHGQPWGKTMVDSLIGSTESFLASQAAFRENPDLVIAGPSEFFLSGRRLMLENATNVSALLAALAPGYQAPEEWGFFAGTMFWSRPEVWAGLAQWVEDHHTLFDGEYALDGLWVHAIERLFGLLPISTGSKVALLHRTGGTTGRYVQVQHDAALLVNQATSEQLVREYEDFAAQYRLFEEAQLLDIEKYKEHLMTAWSWSCRDAESVDLIWHYLLIGQFSGAVEHSLAWGMHARNREIHWVGYLKQPRVAGMTSIIIPVYNNLDLTERCVDAVTRNTTRGTYEIILVDNGSDADTRDGLLRIAREYRSTRVTRLEQNMFFAFGSNYGFTKAKGEFCVFLNNDTEVQKNWLPPLLEPLVRRAAFAVQPLLLYPDGLTQCVGVAFSDKSVLGYPFYQNMKPGERFAERTRTMKAVTGACMAVRAKDFARASGFDPIFVNGQEDVDLCLRLHKRTHLPAMSVTDSKVLHHESKTAGRGLHVSSNRHIFVDRWKKTVLSDDTEIYEQDGFEVTSWTREKGSRPDSIKTVRPNLARSAAGTSFISEQPTGIRRSIQAANVAYREGRYATAIMLYEMLNYPIDGLSVDCNIKLAKSRIEAIENDMPASRGKRKS